MAVPRRTFIGAGAVTAASYLAGLEHAAAARKRKRVLARAGLAQGVGTVGITVARTRLLDPPGGQEAVSLTPADGETITGGVQSNFASNGFYTRLGHTRARDWTGMGFTGFDDLNFMPIVTWLTDFGGTGFYSRMDDLGLNGMLPCAGSIDLDNNISFEKWAAVTDGSHAGGTVTSGQDPGVVAVSTGEEPSTQATYEAILSAAATWLGSSDGPGRMHLFNFADNLLNGDIDNVYFPDDMVIAGDWTTCDQYWFAGAPNDAGGSQSKLHFRLYGLGGSATTAQCARGSHYGSMMDSIRKNYPAGQVAPFGVWIENGAPYTEAASAAITPAQMKWAIWSTIVHGARSIHYFNHTFRSGDPLATGNNFANDGYGGPGVAGTGIYAAAKEVNLRALALAPVIKSPFDGYFVYGDRNTITTTGFLTAVTSTNARSEYAGVDASCRWYPTDSQHYIFATTREQDGTTNWPVTFRMVDQGQITATEVHESNVINIERGGGIPGGFCEFDDTFATAATYKTYRID